MSSKQLKSILNALPSATAKGEQQQIDINNNSEYNIHSFIKHKEVEETERIVAVVPKELKNQIKEYIKLHKGTTERIVVLRALKALGFKVSDDILVDKRTTR